MRPVVLTILMLAYGVFGVAFAAWALLGRGAAADSPLALPLPEAVLWTAAAANLVIAAGIARRMRAIRWFAVAVHAVVTTLAVVAAVQHVLEGHLDASTCLEMAMKCGVHAGLCLYWWRARSVAAWFGGDRR